MEEHVPLDNIWNLHDLAQTRTDEAGRFQISAALDQPATRNPDGSVRLQLLYLAGNDALMYAINALPPTPSQAAWTWPDGADTMAVSEAVLDTLDTDETVIDSRLLAGEPITDLALSLAGGSSVPNLSMRTSAEMVNPGKPEGGAETGDTDDQLNAHVSSATDATGSAALVDAAEAAALASEGCKTKGWRNTNTYRNRYVPIHYNQLFNRTKVKFSWGTTSKTQMGIAYTGKGKNYAGGLAYSMDQDDSAGLSKTWDGVYTGRIFQAEWKYQKQELWCAPHYPGVNPFDTGKRRWVPKEWSLGSKEVPAATWQCDAAKNETRIAANTWVSRSVTQEYSGFFEIAGVELKSAQSTNESHLTEYIIKNAFNEADLCGRDGPIKTTRFVKENAF